MAFDGAGTFLRLYSWVVDATNGVKIRADRHDEEDNNLAAGLSNCITKDGQTAITQNIPWNSRRLISLADPIDPQDAATKDYADTKVAKVGDGTVTGNLTVTGNTTITGDLDVGGKVSATGYKTRKGLPGPYGGNFFNFDWTGNLEAWVDNTNLGALATQIYVNNSAATKLPLTGGTVTGELVVATNYLRFGTAGGPGYIMWNGAGNYSLGGGGTIWHSGNFNPAAATNHITSLQLIYAGSHNHTDEGQADPFRGGLACGFGYPEAYPHGTFIARYRYLQAYANGGWWTVDYYP